MMPKSIRFSEFAAALSFKRPAPVYFLRGPDAFLHEEGRNAAAAAVLPEVRDWCFSEVIFKPGSLATAFENASQRPMVGDRVVCYVSCPDDFGRATEGDAAALAAYVKSPPPFATVIFAARNPDRRRKFIQALEKDAVIVELTPPPPAEAAAWLTTFLHARGVQIEPKVAQSIARRFETAAEGSERARVSGVNLVWMRTEIEKLLTARRGTDRIGEQDVALLAEPRDEHEIGRLLAALAGRKLEAAISTLRDLAVSREPETLVLWCIGDLFRQALKAPPGPARSAPWKSTGAFSTFEIAPRVHQAYSRQEMARALRLVRDADLAVKSSWKDSHLLLEGLIWQIAAGENTSARSMAPR